MPFHAVVIALSLALSLIAVPGSAQVQENGRIVGRLVHIDGTGIASATVLLSDGRRPAEIAVPPVFTERQGQFSFSNLVPGTYSITLILGERSATIPDIPVSSGETVTLADTAVDWVAGLEEKLTVSAPSRQLERLIDAPAAAALIVGPEIERKASDGQAAKLVEFTPGAQVTQGGLWDFNIGTRGFNRSLSRRVAVILDGRDLSLPFFGYQGWAAFSFPLDDLTSLELVRGPDAALYGSNASGGIISMTSKEPRLSQGGFLRVAGGQQDTINLDGRWAGRLGKASRSNSGEAAPAEGWYARAVGGARRSDGFAVSRVDRPEYSSFCDVGAFGDCLPREVVSLDGEDAEVFYGGLRLDRFLKNGLVLTTEGGYAQGGFGVFQAAGQRSKSVGNEGKRPWARFDVKNGGRDGFDVSASYDGYYEPSGYIGLSTGTQFNSNAYRLQVEGQTNRHIRGDAIGVVIGGTAALEKMDSFNPSVGGQTFLFRPIRSDKQALFGLGTWKANARLRILLAGRGDWSSLHDFQISPKVSAIYALGTAPEGRDVAGRSASSQTIRVSFGSGFQTPNSLEYFLQAPVAPPADLSALNALCAPFGVDCRFGATPVLALGNEDLGVEKVRTWELGYTGVLGGRALVTAEYYRSHSTNLATSLLPQIGTPLGRLNPRFGPWRGPTGLPPPIVDLIRTLVPLLSNGADGSNLLAAASYAEFRSGRTQGMDLAASYFFAHGWRSFATYSWFDFSLPASARAAEGLLLPNAPPHAFSAGLAYEGRRLDGGVDGRWVHGFRWADGFFLGNVHSYTTVDATALYRLSREASRPPTGRRAGTVSVSLNASNLFDDHHWEAFGGALIGRRVLLGLQYNW